MSGSGGGGDDSTSVWRPSGGYGGGGSNDGCNITEVTNLSSPNQQVVSKLAAGQVLDIILEVGKVKRLLANTKSGETAGSITSARMLDLIDCIEKGNDYGASIRSIASGRVELEISRK
jgi:hypothetical protein